MINDMEQKEIMNIVIADTQFLIVEALKSLIVNKNKYSIVAEVNNSNELKKVLETFQVDVLITDPAFIDFNGCNELKQIKNRFINLSIVILTNKISIQTFTELHRAGIDNIIYKTASTEEIFDAIEASVKGKKYYCSEILDLLIEVHDKREIHNEPHLTFAEIEIVRHIADGMTTREIAAYKNISIHTVTTHRKNIFRKLDINNSSELMKYAIKVNLLKETEFIL